MQQIADSSSSSCAECYNSLIFYLKHSGVVPWVLILGLSWNQNGFIHQFMMTSQLIIIIESLVLMGLLTLVRNYLLHVHIHISQQYIHICTLHAIVYCLLTCTVCWKKVQHKCKAQTKLVGVASPNMRFKCPKGSKKETVTSIKENGWSRDGSTKKYMGFTVVG